MTKIKWQRWNGMCNWLKYKSGKITLVVYKLHKNCVNSCHWKFMCRMFPVEINAKYLNYSRQTFYTVMHENHYMQTMHDSFIKTHYTQTMYDSFIQKIFT